MVPSSSPIASSHLRFASVPDLREAIEHALEHAAHLLPDQAPLEMFVHHNTLHAFQHEPFHDALRSAKAVFGAEVYRSEQAFRDDLASGRIDMRHLDRELDRYLRQRGLDAEESIGGWCSRRALFSLALRVDLSPPTRAALRWRVREEHFDRRLSAMAPADTAAVIARGRTYLEEVVAEATTEELTRRFLGPHGVPARMGERYAIALERSAILRMLKTDPEPLVAGSMWQTCRALARSCPRTARLRPPPGQSSHRDAVLAAVGVDVWQHVHPQLLRWAAAYLDEGFAYWPMPQRDGGFFVGVRDLVLDTGMHVAPWLRRAARIFGELRLRNASAYEAIAEMLGALGVEPAQFESTMMTLLWATPGFAGMFSRLERHPHERGPGAPPTSLADFCAVRLVFERAALEQAADDHRLGDLRHLEQAPVAVEPPPHPDADGAYRLFLVAQALGMSPPQLDAIDPADAGALLDALDAFEPLERQHVFLEAYEHRYRDEILDGMRRIRPADPADRGPTPHAQYAACIDDREESFRRHIEEIDPLAETFGVAGSFGLAIQYRGLDAGCEIALAPAGVRPRHEIVEQPRPEADDVAHRRRRRRRRWGTVLHQTFFGSRNALRGALASLVLGPLAWIPLSIRVLAPRASMRMLDRLGQRSLPAPRTQLANAESGETGPRGLAQGYTLEEQIDRVFALLEGMGLRESFAPLVFLLAHGSTSLNNPHEAAHDCGACGGRRGGATARLLASFANDPRVRVEVAKRGIEIPDGTWFIAGEHDTSDDRVDLYDLDLVPAEHAAALAQAIAVLDQARARNGHERARKFEMAALRGSVDEGLRHVEGRASHLAEPRPEYGHCTNAICVVGRRTLTRGLFLDRRAFLVSYDPETDPEGAVLERLLAIAGPVGAGINLEYYFSIVDPERFGCGTKLPHNICGYLGVLNGTSGDLRTGLPLQMTEIHEPMRLLVIVEATPQTLLEIAGRQPLVLELVTNAWIQLVSVDPHSGQMQVFEDGAFVPYADPPAPLPTAPTSVDYYGTSREFLPPAKIAAGLGRAS